MTGLKLTIFGSGLLVAGALLLLAASKTIVPVSDATMLFISFMLGLGIALGIIGLLVKDTVHTEGEDPL